MIADETRAVAKGQFASVQNCHSTIDMHSELLFLWLLNFMIAFIYIYIYEHFLHTKNYYIKTNRKVEPLVQDKCG